MAQAAPPPYEISNAINEDDRGLMITTVAAILLTCSVLFWILRLWMRWPWKALFGIDDGCTCIAHAFGVAQTCATLAAIPRGLGKKPGLLSSAQVEDIEKLVYASDILFILAVWLSRLAVAIIFIRLTSSREQGRQMRFYVYGVAIVTTACLFTIAIREDALHPWLTNLSTSTLNRWIANGVLGAIVETILLVLSIILVWGLQMSRRQKLTVVSGFAARLVILAPLAIRLVSLHDHVDSTNFSSSYTMPALWTQLEMHLTLISATVPCLRIFLKSFNTGYYGMTLENLDPTGTVLATKGDSYNLSNMRSGGSNSANLRSGHSVTGKAGEKYKISNPTQQQVSKAGTTTSRVTARDARESDGDSDRSDRGIFVRQTVNVAYD